MFLEFPDDSSVAYTEASQYQYMWGENLLVAPVYEDVQADANGNDVRNGIYLPDEEQIWIDYWSGNVYEGGQTVKPEVPEDRGGFLFVRGGAVIPTDIPRQHTEQGDTENIILELYPYGVSHYDFYEDDGISLDYESGKRTVTRISMEKKNGECEIVIGERKGEFAGIGKRTYTIRLFAEKKPDKVTVAGAPVIFTYEGCYAAFEMGSETEAHVVLG